MRALMLTVICILIFTASAFADKIDIKPKYIQQMDYKVSQVMPCNWDSPNTVVWGYYGKLPEQKGSESQLEQMDAQKNMKSQLTKLQLDGKIVEGVFGTNLNLGFTPEMMQNDGMPLQLVEVEFGTISKKCKSGFSTGLFTK